MRAGLPPAHQSSEVMDIVSFVVQFAYLTYLWKSPSEFTGRIPPSELNVYRDTHQILLPCCLCPLADPHAPDHVESAIYEAREGEFKGKWVASCASESCAYIGERLIHC